jgi:putative FmdB family regulatory protein
MPLYSYRCDNCGVQFEQRQHFTDPPLVRCPECGEDALRKLYQPVGVVFKGSGFYATDHRSPSGQNSIKKSEKPEPTSSTEPTTAKPEKTATKTEKASEA